MRRQDRDWQIPNTSAPSVSKWEKNQLGTDTALAPNSVPMTAAASRDRSQQAAIPTTMPYNFKKFSALHLFISFIAMAVRPCTMFLYRH